MDWSKKKRVIYQLDEDLPKTNLERVPKRIEVPLGIKNSRCFGIEHFLDAKECEWLIEKTKQIGYEMLNKEYKEDYRDNSRVLVRNPKLAVDLYERLKPFFSRGDIDNAHPYGFANSGTWKPVAMNDVFKFSRYGIHEHFNPHYDGSFIVSNEFRSIYTLLIYLNEDYTGGHTYFFKKYTGRERYEKGTKQILPKKGVAVLFNHDVCHSGAYVKSGIKFVVKTEIIFHRCEWSSVPSLIGKYTKDPDYEQAAKLYKLAEKLEEKGDVAGSTSAYLQAVKIQLKHRTFPKQSTITNDSTLCLNVEIFSYICNFLDLRQIVKCIQVSKRWQNIMLDGLVWWNCYKRDFPNLFPMENSFRGVQDKEETAFLRDWYQSYKTTYLLFHSKRPALCIDTGGCYMKYGIAGKEIHVETSQLGVETHPHFLHVGTGMIDIWNAGHKLYYSFGVPRPKFRPYSRGEVRDWDALWILWYHIYKFGLYTTTDDEADVDFDSDWFTKIKYHSHFHPLLLAEGRIPFDRKKLYSLLFELLGVPSVCIVNSSLLVAYEVQRPSCMVIDCGYDSIVCTPIWDYKVQHDQIKTFPIAGRTMTRLFTKLCPVKESMHYKHYNVKKMSRVRVDETDEEMRKSSQMIQSEWSGATINLQGNNFKACEVLFNYDVLSECPSVPLPEGVSTTFIDFVYNSIMDCDSSKTQHYFKNIVLCGGLAEIAGFTRRFEKELTLKKSDIDIVVPESPSRAVVQGAFKFSTSSAFVEQSVNRFEYIASRTSDSTLMTEPSVASSLFSRIQVGLNDTSSAEYKKEKCTIS